MIWEDEVSLLLNRTINGLILKPRVFKQKRTNEQPYTSSGKTATGNKLYANEVGKAERYGSTNDFKEEISKQSKSN